jgi:hypothetical protein
MVNQIDTRGGVSTLLPASAFDRAGPLNAPERAQPALLSGTSRIALRSAPAEPYRGPLLSQSLEYDYGDTINALLDEAQRA